MGYNLSIRCHDCKVEMGILRGYESAGIYQFITEHGKGHNKELQVDNGFAGSDEWTTDEGYEERVYPVDWPEATPSLGRIANGFSIEGIGDGSRGVCILKDGVPFIDCSPGGTGPCWNIDDAEERNQNPGTVIPLHICDLDELIGALLFLKRSQAHKENVARWA